MRGVFAGREAPLYHCHHQLCRAGPGRSGLPRQSGPSCEPDVAGDTQAHTYIHRCESDATFSRREGTHRAAVDTWQPAAPGPRSAAGGGGGWLRGGAKCASRWRRVDVGSKEVNDIGIRRKPPNDGVISVRSVEVVVVTPVTTRLDWC